ncbi:MAG: serine protease, partial [bacterium]|nr:serine protease [bacterium]
QAGANGKVAGWGATDPYGTVLPTNLMEVSLPVISNTACNEAFRDLFSLGNNVDIISDNMFCAGYVEGGKDSCVGDSGGPFIIDGKLAGLVSWGPDACALPDAYGVYTRVSNYTAWLNSIIQTDVPADFSNGWYYGGSLYDMITQLDLNWHPSNAPIQNLGVSMSIGFIE